MRTREGLIIERAGPTNFLKSRALSGWLILKWRSESWTTQITDSGPPFTSIILPLFLVFLSQLDFASTVSAVAWEEGMMENQNRRIRFRMFIFCTVCSSLSSDSSEPWRTDASCSKTARSSTKVFFFFFFNGSNWLWFWLSAVRCIQAGLKFLME